MTLDANNKTYVKIKLCTAPTTAAKASARPSPLLAGAALLLPGPGAGAETGEEGDLDGDAEGAESGVDETEVVFGTLMSTLWPATQWPGKPQMKK